jgi:hypothetical protein
MNRPHCSIHGDLARDLALGALGDDETRRAEEALAGCGRCRDWWAALEVEAVELGVAQGLAAFRPPAQRPAARPVAGRAWARIAAAAVLVAGGGAAWLAIGGRPDPGAGDGAAAQGAERRGAVAAAANADAARTEGRRGEILLADDLESGTLDAWRVYPSS